MDDKYQISKSKKPETKIEKKAEKAKPAKQEKPKKEEGWIDPFAQ